SLLTLPKPLQHIRPKTSLPGRIRLQDNSSADRLHRRIEADDKPVSRLQRCVRFHPKLCKTVLSRGDGICIQQDRTAEHLCRSAVKVKTCLIPHRSSGPLEKGQPYIYVSSGPDTVRGGKHAAPADLFPFDTRKVEC